MNECFYDIVFLLNIKYENLKLFSYVLVSTLNVKSLPRILPPMTLKERAFFSYIA